jgi:transposase-like protein
MFKLDANARRSCVVAKNESVWRVAGFEAAALGMLEIRAEHTVVALGCPNCQSHRRPRRYGSLVSSYRDAPFLGTRVSIVVTTQRYQCGDCGQAFLQDLPGIADKRRMTSRCASYILDQVMARSSMKDVARIVGIDEKGVRNVFADRGLIFSVGDPPSSDRFVCESCLGIHPKSDHRLAPAKHFGNWRAGEMLREANVCKECFEFAIDPWRAGLVGRL